MTETRRRAKDLVELVVQQVHGDGRMLAAHDFAVELGAGYEVVEVRRSAPGETCGHRWTGSTTANVGGLLVASCAKCGATWSFPAPAPVAETTDA